MFDSRRPERSPVLTPPKPVTIIVNPVSGEGAALHKANILRRRLHGKAIPAQIVRTRSAGDASRLARQFAPESRAVVAVGGDGTVNEVVQGLVGTDTPLAVLPTGTANVLAHELGIRKHVASVAGVIASGFVTRVDLGQVGSRYFICIASCGFDAAVTYDMHCYRKGNINYAHYVPITVKAFCNYPYHPIHVTIDRRDYPRPVRHVLISNTRSYGGPFQIATRARLDDGMLDVVLFRHSGPFWLGLYLFSTVFRAHRFLPGVTVLRGRTIDIRADRPVPFQVDGDFVGYSPITVQVRAAALAVLVSARKHRRGVYAHPPQAHMLHT